MTKLFCSSSLSLSASVASARRFLSFWATSSVESSMSKHSSPFASPVLLVCFCKLSLFYIAEMAFFNFLSSFLERFCVVVFYPDPICWVSTPATVFSTGFSGSLKRVLTRGGYTSGSGSAESMLSSKGISSTSSSIRTSPTDWPLFLTYPIDAVFSLFLSFSSSTAG